MFKETSMAFDMTPGKKKFSSKSPARESSTSRRSMQNSIGLSPSRSSNILDMHRRTTNEQKESPSKAAKIVLRYINSYPDVGP